MSTKKIKTEAVKDGDFIITPEKLEEVQAVEEVQAAKDGGEFMITADFNSMVIDMMGKDKTDQYIYQRYQRMYNCKTSRINFLEWFNLRITEGADCIAENVKIQNNLNRPNTQQLMLYGSFDKSLIPTEKVCLMQANKPLWDAKKVTGDQYLNKSYVLVTVDAKAKVAKTLAGELLKVVLKFTGTTPEDVIGFAESWSAIIDDCTNKTTNKEVLKKIETNIQEKSVSDADDDISDSNEQAVA